MSSPTPDDSSKNFYESKTFWFNVVTTIVLVAFYFTQVPTTGGTQVPSWLVPTAAAVYGIGNIVLRVWFTSTPIAH